MILFFNKKANDAEQLRQQQYRIAYEYQQQIDLRRKHKPLFDTLVLLGAYGNLVIEKEAVKVWWWDYLKASLPKTRKPLLEIRATDDQGPREYTLTMLIPEKHEYDDFPYAQQLFYFLVHGHTSYEIRQLLAENGNRIPKTNEYLENLLKYAGFGTQNLPLKQPGPLLHELTRCAQGGK